MFAPKETIVCAEWRGVHALQNQVVWVGDECLLAPCICTPQKIDNGGVALVEMTYDAVGESFPTFPLVAVGLTCSHCQYGIQKEHTLLCPVDEIWVGVVNAQITLDFLEDVHKRRWRVNTG